MTDRQRGQRVLAEAVPDLIDRPDVSVTRMFGSDGYAVRGKLFAFVAGDGCLTVKLPAERIDALDLDNMVMRGSPMKEWAKVPQADADRWRWIVEEALAFVDEITP